MDRRPLPRMLTLSIIAGLTVFVMAKPLATADLACFMAMGRDMLATGHLYETETFAFTELGREFINGTWLAQVLFYGLFKIGGYGLLALFLGLTTGLSVAVVAHHGRLRGGSDGAAAAAAFFAFVLILQNLGLRPQTFSLPLFALSFLIADRYADRAFAPPVIAVIFALWPNLHGAFPAALGILFTLAGAPILRDLPTKGLKGALSPGAPGRRPLILALVALFATFLNPYGPGIYAYIATNSYLPRTRNLDEWLPAEPLSSMGVRLGLSVLAIALVIILRQRKRPLPAPRLMEDGIILAAFLWLALGSQRMILWWGLAAAPIFAGHLGTYWGDAQASSTPTLHRRLFQGSIVFWGALLILANPWVERRDKDRVEAEGFSSLSQEDTPAQAIEKMKSLPSSRVFNKMMWGGYITWRLGPAHSPFVDSRIWVYGDDTWGDYVELSDAPPGWQERLRAYQIDTLLLEPRSQGPLIEAARAAPEWALLFEANNQALFRLREPRHP